MSGHVTVSVKIPEKLRERMDELGIKPSEVLRRAIEEEVRKRETEKIKDSVKKLRPILDRVSLEDVVKGIREDRDSR